MAQAATKTKPKTRRELAEELVTIHRTHRADLERADGIKAELRRLATDDGNFEEVFSGIGRVKANGAKPERFKGTVPTVDVAKFNALTDKQRQKLLDQGVITMVDEYAKAYYGQVTVDLY